MATEPLVLVVQLWARDGDVAALEAFEREVAPVMARHGGTIERAIRIDVRGDGPHEIQVVSFPARADFDAYRVDPATIALSAMRDRVIARTIVSTGRSIRY